MTTRRLCLIALGLALLAPAGTALADTADVFFDDSAVHEIRIYFDDPDWYNTLYNAHATDLTDPYFPARFVSGTTDLYPVGVRMKGFSSFNVPTEKKSFKIDFNLYDAPNADPETTFLGLKKLNLNNSYNDPTMLREKTFWDFAKGYVPALRAVHCRLYVNDVLWGLYVAVEQVDKTFTRSRFGDSESGNLYKGAIPEDDGGAGTEDFGSDLTWLGTDPAPYHQHYQLKTNELLDDYTGLIEFIDVLNNTPTQALPAAIEPLLDVPTTLYGLALDNLYVNLDSYTGAAHNYYLYDRTGNGQFEHLIWDTNMAYANALFGLNPGANPLQVGPLWLPSNLGARPLMTNLWEVSDYKRRYLRDLAQMLREGFDYATQKAKIDRLAGIIRADVYADPHKQYTSAQFDTNLYTNVPGSGQTIYGLTYFVTQRAAYINAQLNGFADKATDLRINEVMALNTTTVDDGHGHFVPWVEIHNLGPGLLNLTGLYLTDTTLAPTKWALPAVNLDDGQYLVIWMDGATSEGNTHANFTLAPGGGELFFYLNGTTLVDSVTYPALDANVSYARVPSGAANWETTNRPTPGTANLAYLPPPTTPPVLYVNEFIASNQAGLENPDLPGNHPDWIEILNPGDQPVNMGGLYLTDNLAKPTKWRFTSAVVCPAHGFLVIFADDQAALGPRHASFKLDAAGEQIGLIHSDGTTVIDALTFGAQTTDVSFGRYPDGDAWRVLPSVTPGASNNPRPWIGGTQHTPSTPTALDPVWVTATITDNGVVTSAALTYDSGTGWTTVAMLDDGAHGDFNAGDHIYGGQIPAAGAGTPVTYYVTATDDLAATTTDPADAPTTTYAYVSGSCTVPGEATNLTLSPAGAETLLAWSAAPLATASSVLRGLVAALPVGPGGEDETCLAGGLAGTSFADPAAPASGAAFWYLVAGSNDCGRGSLGQQELAPGGGTPRVTTTACP